MFEGVNVVITTPFKKGGAIDEKSLRAKIRFLIRGGIRGSDGVLVPTGSTGECHLLRLEEFKQIWSIVMEEAEGKSTVVLGTNRTSTDEAVELCQYAEKLGADGVMNLAPFYWKPEDPAVLNHYRKINDSANIPILVYNNMYVNQVDISVPVLSEICALDHVKAIKECTPSLEKMERVVRTLGDSVEIINGRGELNEPYGYLMGTKGYVSIVANYAPELTVKLHRLALAGDYPSFMKLKNERIMPMLDFISTLPPSHEAIVIRTIEDILGISKGSYVRAPFLPLSDEYKRRLEAILRTTQFLND